MADLSFDIPIAFLFAALLLELTPGPNMGYLAIVAARAGKRAGLAAIAGTTLALGIYLVASVEGLAEVASRWPRSLQALKWTGVAYLLWLAWDAWREPNAGRASDGVPLRGFFLRGFFANLLNPKAALLYVSILPSFVDRVADTGLRALYLGGIHIAISIVIHTIIVLSSARLGTWLVARPNTERRARRMMALALAGVAVWLGTSQAF